MAVILAVRHMAPKVGRRIWRTFWAVEPKECRIRTHGWSIPYQHDPASTRPHSSRGCVRFPQWNVRSHHLQMG